jgi:hypothetical protein
MEMSLSHAHHLPKPALVLTKRIRKLVPSFEIPNNAFIWETGSLSIIGIEFLAMKFF